MNESSPSNETGRARRLIVTVLIGTAAAAVTAGVALNERHPGEAVLERAEASPALAGATSKRMPLSESAPSRIGEMADAATIPGGDASLPSAADALKVAPERSSEDAPTF